MDFTKWYICNYEQVHGYIFSLTVVKTYGYMVSNDKWLHAYTFKNIYCYLTKVKNTYDAHGQMFILVALYSNGIDVSH